MELTMISIGCNSAALLICLFDMELCQTALLSLSLSQTSKFITTNKSQAASFEAEIHRFITFLMAFYRTLAEKISGQLQVLQILFATNSTRHSKMQTGEIFRNLFHYKQTTKAVPTCFSNAQPISGLSVLTKA